MIYLDNAATGGFKPKSVLDETVRALKYSANPTRSSHKRAIEAAETVFSLRQKVAEFFRFASPERVIFTKNCTESLNLALFGSCKIGGHVVVDCYAHNALVRPLFYLKEKGLIDYTVVYPEEPFLPVTANDIKRAMRRNTYLVAMTHVSNVTGTKNDVEGIGEYLDGSDILFLVDGAQSAGYIDIDVEKSNVDFLCLPAHKGLCCPTGLGFLLVGKRVARLTPHLFGGTGTKSLELRQPTDFPEGFESGTLPTAAIAGGLSGINYVLANRSKIKSKMAKFRKMLYAEVPQNARLFSVPNDVGILSLDFCNIDPSEAASVLDREYDVAARYGFFCAPLIHKFIGSLETGLVRFSFSSFNPLSDGKLLLRIIDEIAKRR